LATELLDEGCAIISQHTDTIGPAVACEEYYARDVYHVGYNVDMTDVAPHASLTSARINWTPYLLGAMKATRAGKRIEDVVSATEHPNNDMSGGLKDGWVELTPLNEKLLPDGAEEVLEEVAAEVRDGRRQVFYGPYKGSNPQDPKDTIDLSVPFIENEDSSVPTFHFLLEDIVAIEE
jgi:basic membrane protein A